MTMTAKDGVRSGTATANRSVRQSPPTERVIAVINLLTAHPDRWFTLTEIIRQLAITKATCFSLLQSLTRAGYLVRHPDKTYSLGPALVAAGRVAQKAFSALGHARSEMDALSKTFSAVVSAAAVVDDELVIVERVGPDGESDHLQVGHRMPFAPPLGTPFVAWGDDDDFERWLARSSHELTRDDQQRWRRIVTGVREVGFGVERMSENWSQIRALVGELADDQLSPQVRTLLSNLVAEIGPAHYLPDEIRGRGRLSVSVIYAPVLDEQGRCEMSLALNLFREMSSRDVRLAGNTLHETSQRLSAMLGLRDGTITS